MSVLTTIIGAKELEMKLDRYRSLVDGRGLRWISTEVGKKTKKELLDTAKQDVGSDAYMSGWRRPPRKRVRVRAGFDFRSDGVIEFKPKPNGVWKVLEEGRDSGISRRRATRGRVYGRTTGKQTWSRAWASINPRVPGWVATANSELLKNSWKGI